MIFFLNKSLALIFSEAGVLAKNKRNVVVKSFPKNFRNAFLVCFIIKKLLALRKI